MSLGATQDHEGQMRHDADQVSRAPRVVQTDFLDRICRVAMTYGYNVAGTFDFEAQGDNTLKVTYSLTGLPVGYARIVFSHACSCLPHRVPRHSSHGYHVHTLGDIFTSDGMAVGGHFIGSEARNQRTGTLKEIGALDNGNPLTADASGNSAATYFDQLAKLNGPDSIVGRSVQRTIHSLLPRWLCPARSRASSLLC